MKFRINPFQDSLNFKVRFFFIEKNVIWPNRLLKNSAKLLYHLCRIKSHLKSYLVVFICVKNLDIHNKYSRFD